MYFLECTSTYILMASIQPLTGLSLKVRHLVFFPLIIVFSPHSAEQEHLEDEWMNYHFSIAGIKACNRTPRTLYGPRENTVRRLQFSIQQHHPSAADR